MRKKLEEVADVTKLAGFEFTKYMKYIDDGEIIAIRALNLKSGSLVLDDIKRISKEVSEELPRSQLHKYDIVLSYTGTIGETAQILEEGKYHLAPNVAKVVPKKDLIDPKYLFQYIRGKEFKQQMINYAHGSTQPTIPMATIRELTVPIYDLNTEKKIASVLSSLDDKIGLNETINKNLLQQAIAIFTNTLQQSESITYVDLGALADVKGGKRLPKGVNLITEPNSHPYIRVRDLNNVVFASLSADYEYVDDETQKSISRYITSAGDVLISIVGTIGLTAIVDKSLDNANLTENCVKVTNLNGITPEYLLLYLRSAAGIEAITKGTVGAVQQKLPIKNIQTLPVPLLSKSEAGSLNDILLAIFNQISANVTESKRLAEIRDALLPKLMSGELDVTCLDL